MLLKGTLDTLMQLMDELQKHDAFLGSLTVKLAKQLVDLELDTDECTHGCGTYSVFFPSPPFFFYSPSS